MADRESKVESCLRVCMRKVGGDAVKHVNPGRRGDPDRLCPFPDGFMPLVETKWAAGVEPEDHQTRRHKWWRARKVPVFVCRTQAEVLSFMRLNRHHWDTPNRDV